MTGARAVIAAAVVVLGVSACSGDDPEPKIAPSESPTPTAPSTSPASGTAAPTMPPEAAGTDAAAAEAFVRFYWEMVNYAQETGDLEGLRQISSDQCVACQAGLDYLEEVFAQDGVIAGGTSRVMDPETVFVKADGALHAVVEFTLDTSRQRVDFPIDTQDEIYKGASASIRARLEPAGDGWIMNFWDTL